MVTTPLSILKTSQKLRTYITIFGFLFQYPLCIDKILRQSKPSENIYRTGLKPPSSPKAYGAHNNASSHQKPIQHTIAATNANGVHHNQSLKER